MHSTKEEKIKELLIMNNIVMESMIDYSPLIKELPLAMRAALRLTIKNLIGEIISKIYKEEYTEKELDDLLSFYNSDVGKKSLMFANKIQKECTSHRFNQKLENRLEKQIEKTLETLSGLEDG